MKVYFSGSAYYHKEYLFAYKKIKQVLLNQGTTVLGNIVELQPEEYNNWTDETRVSNYRQILHWIDQCDFAVIESSYPSTLHVGHEISLLTEKGKPVVALYHQDHKPKMFVSGEDVKIIWVEYKNESELEAKLGDAIEIAKKNMDIRFNFFITPPMISYMDWLSEKKRIPRSVYLRGLIDKEMHANKEYLASQG